VSIAADVFEFVAHQRGDRSVVRLADRETGLSARIHLSLRIARRSSATLGEGGEQLRTGPGRYDDDPSQRIQRLRRVDRVLP